jgi:hypothetical protein
MQGVLAQSLFGLHADVASERAAHETVLIL